MPWSKKARTPTSTIFPLSKLAFEVGSTRRGKLNVRSVKYSP
jgi:hypothetical protein